MTEQALHREILRSVSRSFYLSIRLLPAQVREPIGLAYLLARASDTIADTTGIPRDTRIAHLAAFAEMIRGHRRDALPQIQRDIQPDHLGEKALIARLDECLAWFDRLCAFDNAQVKAVLGKIIRGQTLDLERFGNIETVTALPNAEALREYTYLVAGCVGEFWTIVCAHHVPSFSKISDDQLIALGIRFGQGLQLVNILRDLPADLREGRCYLPADELAEAGIDPLTLRDAGRPEALEKCRARWIAEACGYFDDAARYIAAVRTGRLRIACFLPWYLGVKTLELIESDPARSLRGKVKVPRATVHKAMLLGAWAAFSDGPLATGAAR